MHLFAFLSLGLTLLAPALAQSNFSETYVIEQSPDFNLVVQTKNKTLDGKRLGACHNGAAHEALCIYDGPFNNTDNFASFQFNTTRWICTETNSTGTFTIPCNNDQVDPALQTGVVTWWLHSGSIDGPGRAPQSLYLEYVPWSNVVTAQISFFEYEGQGDSVAFDKHDLMNILEYYDDTLEPAPEYLETPQILYNWYICQTYNYAGYHYTALAWVIGPHKPQNPTCQKVDVKRVWL